MDDKGELARFAEDLSQEVISAAHDEEGSIFFEEAFTWLIAQYLSEAAEIEDLDVCHYQGHGMKVNGYSLEPYHGRLNLLTTVLTQTVPPTSVQKADVEQAFRRAITFTRKALLGLHKELEESSPAFDMALSIHEARGEIAEIRVFLISDGITTVSSLPTGKIDGIKASLQIWDIERLYRLQSSGKRQEPIEINLVERFGRAVPCLEIDGRHEYRAILAALPGTFWLISIPTMAPGFSSRMCAPIFRREARSTRESAVP